MAIKNDGWINQQDVMILTGHKKTNNPVAKIPTKLPQLRDALEIRSRQQYMRRFKWSGLPLGLDPNIIERILYYRGRAVFFKLNDRYYCLPFALNGNIDVYGRYMTVTPLTFNGSIYTDSDGKQQLKDGEFIPDLKINVCYDSLDTEGKNGVILQDYINGVSEFVEPRYSVSSCFDTLLAEILVLVRHNLIASARINSVRVMDEGQKTEVEREFDNMERAILEDGKRIFAVTSATGLDEIFQDKQLETQQYMECYVSIDNLRENLIGIENEGIFKKKERMLVGEQELEAGSADLVHQDGLFLRQQFCERFNALFGENIWCATSETVSGIDTDGDGDIDEQHEEKKGSEQDEIIQ